MITFLIGAAIGAGVLGAYVFVTFKVQRQEVWEEEAMQMRALRSLVEALTAENAMIRVSMSAGELTEEGKKVAAMALGALNAVINARKAKPQE